LCAFTASIDLISCYKLKIIEKMSRKKLIKLTRYELKLHDPFAKAKIKH